MRLYVLGSAGQIARSLREAVVGHEDITFGFGARPDVDLMRPDSIQRALDDFRPDVVVNPAAYTAVDNAESESDQAFALNRDGAGAVARAAAACGASVIHLSTDYVFDGKKAEPYLETDPVRPLGVYGRSKLEGELIVAKLNPRHIILRTAWVYAPFGNNFVRTMLRLAADRERLRVVDDQFGCPTYAPDIAGAIISMAQKTVGSGWHPEYAGVTHLAGPDRMTWCGFARRIIAEAARRGGHPVAVDPISTSGYPTKAIRPVNSCLATSRLASVFDIRLPHLEESLTDCLGRLMEP